MPKQRDEDEQSPEPAETWGDVGKKFDPPKRPVAPKGASDKKVPKR
jgi:hypothetical protein